MSFQSYYSQHNISEGPAKYDYKFNAEIEKTLKNDTRDKNLVFQIVASSYATKGEQKKALEIWDLGRAPYFGKWNKKRIDSILSNYRITSAVDYVVERAKKNRIVIINEAHHRPIHRNFSASLLQKLYDNGYRYFGLEALKNSEIETSLLNKRKYPTKSSGYYIKEPRFGNLVRKALKIGFTLFAYETTDRDHDGKQREIDQAESIAKIVNKNPQAKFLIHCGYDHATEGVYTSWEKAMAERLKDLTGIDPLTINQEHFSEKSSIEKSHPLLKSLKLKESSVLVNKISGKPYRFEEKQGWMDITVFHPFTKYQKNRPEWIFSIGKKPIRIELDNLNIIGPLMIYAFKKGEDILKAVPFDILEVVNTDSPAYLALEKGKYIIVVQNQNGTSKKFEFSTK